MRLLLLGPVDLRHGNASLAIGGLKARSVLAMLGLAEGRVVPVDQLIDGIWGEHLPAGVGNALQYHVGVLRKALAGAGADHLLKTRPPGYTLDAATDVADFGRASARARRLADHERLVEAAASFEDALSLWRGPALADLAEAPFSKPKAVALESARLATVEAAIDLELTAGRSREWVPRLEELLTDHPTREHMWGQLMTALYRTGQQAAALEAFARARRLLNAELGVNPSPELQDLQARILAQDPSLQVPAAMQKVVAAGPGVSMEKTRVRSQLHARAAHLVLPDGKRVELGQEPVVIGRHPDCHVVIDDPDVSRQHVRIGPEIGGRGYQATDLGSTNGTRINGHRLGAPTTLGHGDRLEVGAAVLRYEISIGDRDRQ